MLNYITFMSLYFFEEQRNKRENNKETLLFYQMEQELPGSYNVDIKNVQY